MVEGRVSRGVESLRCLCGARLVVQPGVAVRSGQTGCPSCLFDRPVVEIAPPLLREENGESAKHRLAPAQRRYPMNQSSECLKEGGFNRLA